MKKLIVLIIVFCSMFNALGQISTLHTSTQLCNTINYYRVIPYLFKTVYEHQKSIDSLKSQLEVVKAQIICYVEGERNQYGNENNKYDERNRLKVKLELSNIDAIILDQNSPNPFGEETFIHYTIPASVSKAILVIYDNLGRVLKTVVINERGEGILHVYSEKLSSGLYSYSLITDNVTFITKKMVCNN